MIVLCQQVSTVTCQKHIDECNAQLSRKVAVSAVTAGERGYCTNVWAHNTENRLKGSQ